MPDWSYQPLFRPLLFRLPPETARQLTLAALGRLARLPLGPAVIEALGHMQPPAGLKVAAWGRSFPSPVGLSAGLDPDALGAAALARFGVGFVEVGPVTVEPVPPHGRIERHPAEQAIWYPDRPVNPGLTALIGQLEGTGALPARLGIRLAHRPGAGAAEATAERRTLLARLTTYADFFTLETRGGAAEGRWRSGEWSSHLAVLRQTLPDHPLLLCLAPDLDAATVARLLEPALELGLAGVVIGGGVAAPARDGRAPGRQVGPPAHQPSLALVQAIHARWGTRLTIVVEGGVREPGDALRLLATGATFVQVHSGLVYAGPGLPKRINEAVRFYQAQTDASSSASGIDARAPGWHWTALLGAGMVIGGVLAWLVAATRVVLPYDEAFVGLTRAELAAASAQLLPFMAHDRVTLAGTMLSIGVLYWGLAVHGIRQGWHWAWQAARLSAGVGFASFFLFLGFGYFDPLHALVTLLLCPFFLLGLRGRPAGSPSPPTPDLHNDRAWRLGLWGQLCFVALGLGLTLAGLAIAAIGVTSVFVPEDLTFLQTTPAALHAISPRLVPLVAHDRAGFGGALAANGVAVLLTALWGFRPGARWVWWMLLAAGLPGFVATLGIHLGVGYIETWHLAPAVAAVLLFLVGLGLAYPSLCQAERRPISRKPLRP